MRTGRASVTILDGVHVEAYGAKVPLNQVAGLSIPEPTLIVAQPFDPSQLGAIEKAIRSAGLGLNPANDGKIVRIPLPSLTEERRKELSKHVHKLSEEGRNSVRQVAPRRERAAEETAQGSQDLGRRREEGLDEVQKDHRQPHQSRSTTCRRRKTRSCSASNNFQVSTSQRLKSQSRSGVEH